jgi:tetratricopeptide (TPR) repeat protein
MLHKILLPATTLLYGSMLILSTYCFSSCKQNTEAAEMSINDQLSVPGLLERKSVAGPKEERDQIVKIYNDAVTALKHNPEDAKAYLSLASVFITEGRITGNNGYYSNAAIKMLDKVISGNPKDKNILFEGLSLKSAVLLNMHQFKDALAVAEEGKAINDFNSGIYGALVDAHVEMGHYKEAVKDCDQMLSIRPDLRSYSRASYLRQIHGDNNGAIEAMKMAVESGVPGMESTEWARVTWGDLYLNTGKLDTARMIYESSLTYRPGYPYAEMGLARVAAARKNYDEAISHSRNAIKTLSEVSFVSYLGDMYLLKGDENKAMDTYKDVVRLLEDGEREMQNTTIKHNGNRELALAYLNIKNYKKALEHATADYNMRPQNIDANELMAWVLYKKGSFTEAKKYQDQVFITKIKNANQAFKAGLVYAAAGNTVLGDQMKKEALAISPFIDPRITSSVH